MYKQSVYLLSFAIIVGLSQAVVWSQPPDQIVNGEFDDGLNSWWAYGAETGFTMQVVPVTDMSGANAALIDITDASATTSIGIAQAGFVLEPGVTYPIGFTAKAAENRDMVVLLQGTVSGTWPEYVNQTVSLTTSPQTYVIEYTHSGQTIGDDAGEAVNLYLMLKGTWWPMAGDTLNTKVWFDRVYFGAEPPLLHRNLATDPHPADEATDVPRDVALSWFEGEYANTHDVYFGTNFNDVNNGDASVLASPGQATTTFDPEGLLEFGQTYYWRVDEVNAPPDSTVFPGPVWSFTVEPYTYPIQNVAATASSSSTAKGMTPDKTVDGSGMTGDEHSTQDTAMWLSAPFTTLPAWIQYEFDDVYKLSELWVWNSNQTVEPYIGFGAKDVTVEYSLDGAEWTSLGDVELARAPGDVGYAPNTTVDLAGVQAKFVRLTIHSNWSGVLPQVGLSEVRFYYIPVKARQPNPASGATDVPLDVLLTWRSGREAASHEVYFSTDRQAVEDGTAFVDVVEVSRYDPASLDLEYGETYFWKIVEVNDAASPSSWDGDVWEFSTIGYLVVDDFESYTDDFEAGEAIWQTWLDGLTNNTGSVVGYFEAPFAERTIVHGGSQSMPMDYNNVNSPYYSEAERTFDPVQDWTANGLTHLTLFFRGHPPEFLETAPGQYMVSSTSGDVWDTVDHMRLVYKQLTGDGSIVVRVDSMTDTWPWAKAGVMIRESLDPGSSHALMILTPEGRTAFQNRLFRGEQSFTANSAAGAAQFPHWVKLERKGSQFTAWHSNDGTNWVVQTNDEGTSPNPVSINMAQSVYIGLMVTSNNLSEACTAEYSGVQMTGTISGAWQIADIGPAIPGNDPDTLYVAVQDSSNKIGVSVHPDAAVTMADWTEWVIPLSEFGVNVAKVKTLYIGVGDRNDPQPDGAGRLYIDDIRVTRPAPTQ